MDSLIGYLPLLLVVGGGLLAWGRYEQKIANLQRQIDELQRKQEALMAAHGSLEKEIAASLEAIRIALAELRAELKTMRRAG